MSVDNLDQLFTHELKDIYAEEQELADALEQLAKEESNQQLQQIFQQHSEETQQHVERLEEVFDELGESPEAEGGQVLKGLVEEHQSFMEAEPSEQINAAYDTGAGRKAERYEITAYENLIKMANALELSENAVESLQANLSDEREQLDRLENVSQGMNLKSLREQNQ